MGREFPHTLGLKRLWTLLCEYGELRQGRGHTCVSSCQTFGYKVNLYPQQVTLYVRVIFNIYKLPAIISDKNDFSPPSPKHSRFYN